MPERAVQLTTEAAGIAAGWHAGARVLVRHGPRCTLFAFAVAVPPLDAALPADRLRAYLEMGLRGVWGENAPPVLRARWLEGPLGAAEPLLRLM